MYKQVENRVFLILAVLLGLVLVFSLRGKLTTAPSIVTSQSLQVINKEYTGTLTYFLLSNDYVYSAERSLGNRLKIGEPITLNGLTNGQLELCVKHQCFGQGSKLRRFSK